MIAVLFILELADAATTTSSIPLHSWFVGYWGSCSGACGAAETREREVFCQETCSVWKCGAADSSFCEQLHGNAPPNTENCGTFAPACPLSTTNSLVTAPLASSAVPTTPQVPTSAAVGQTPAASPSPAVISCSSYECSVVLGQTVSQIGCLQGVAASCGTACPCWRHKAAPSPSPQPSTLLSPVPSPASSEEDGGLSIAWIIVMIVAIAIALAIFVGTICAMWKARQRSRLLSKLSKVVQSPFEKTEAWKEDATARKVEKDAWNEYFERPPEVKVDFGDVPHKPSRHHEADDSTADSSHCDEEPSGNLPPSQGRVAHDADLSDEEPESFSVPGAKTPKTRGSSRHRNQRTAAEKAFGNLHEHEREKTRTRNTSRSPHPKGTAVPPRKNDEDPNTSGSPKAAKMGKSQSSTPSASTPGDSSGQQQETQPDNPANVGAAADVGVATAVSDHIARLDAELDANRKKDVDFRKQHFKELCLKWHPDKNANGMGEAESAAQANEIFKHLLSRRGGYLA